MHCAPFLQCTCSRQMFDVPFSSEGYKVKENKNLPSVLTASRESDSTVKFLIICACMNIQCINVMYYGVHLFKHYYFLPGDKIRTTNGGIPDRN